MLNLLDLDNWEIWLAVFNWFMFAIVLYALIHKVWLRSITTMITFVGFGTFGALLQNAPFGITVIFLMTFMSYLYYRTMIKPMKQWSKYERRGKHHAKPC